MPDGHLTDHWTPHGAALGTPAPGELLRAYASAALTGGPEELSTALSALNGWIKAIQSLMNPPVTQEVLCICGVCDSTNLSMRVLDGATTMKCRDCGFKIPNSKLVEAAAGIKGINPEELQAQVADKLAERATEPRA